MSRNRPRSGGEVRHSQNEIITSNRGRSRSGGGGGELLSRNEISVSIHGRRSSTGELKPPKTSSVRVLPASRDDSFIGQGINCGVLKKINDELVYEINKKHEEREKRLIKNASGVMEQNPGSSISAIKTKKTRSRIIVDLEHATIITHHIVIGSQRDAQSQEALTRLGITHVLNVAAQVDNFFEDVFLYHRIMILDAPNVSIIRYMVEALAFIRRVESLHGRVFVHCISGVSRSVSIVLLHLMKTHGIPLKVAYEHIKTLRPFILPNEGFRLQLAEYEVEQFGASSVVQNSGKDWEFYGWNRVKHGMKRQKTLARSSGCLIL